MLRAESVAGKLFYNKNISATNKTKIMEAKEIEKLWRIEPYYDGISTVVTIYKVVDQNGTL